jgi:hypothetical protein
LGGLEENQLGTPRGLVPADFPQAQDSAIELDSLPEVIHPVASVQQFRDGLHAASIADRIDKTMAEINLLRLRWWI